jgi:(p)ppGpp synthase/HD superfamily hydrolase
MKTPQTTSAPNTSEEKLRLVLTERFTRAVEYVRQLHTEYRKGTEIPYMAHLVGVAALVMSEAGRRVPVTEDMVIAALLHDVVEDKGGQPRLEEVEDRFGSNVARMVKGLSDTFAEDHDKKEGWEERKTAYIARLRDETDDVLLISAADKLYNAKAILDDYREIGEAVFKRFKRGRDQQLWYFDELLKVFRDHPSNRLVDEFERVVNELKRLILESAEPAG